MFLASSGFLVSSPPWKLTNPANIILAGAAYVFLAAMATTSFDGAVAWLGVRRWRLLHLVGGRPSFTLVEAFPGPDELAAFGPEGRFCHELVVPFQRRTPAGTRAAGPVPEAAEHDRVFPPGSEWLYLKIYTGPATSDRLLLDLLETLRAVTVGAWDRWFFIRYADPAPHLRLRFHGDPALLSGTLLPLLHRLLAPHLQAGSCWKVQVDTYERELERYGGPEGMPLAEAWFEQDSESALELLQRAGGDEGPRQRWQFAFRGIDAILRALGFDLATRLKVVERTRDALQREFPEHLSIQLGARFRAQRKELETLLLEDPGPLSDHQVHCLHRLREASAQGHLSLPLEDLAGSLVHMHVNRHLRTAHRAHERVLTDFLARLYRSGLAR